MDYFIDAYNRLAGAKRHPRPSNILDMKTQFQIIESIGAPTPFHGPLGHVIKRLKQRSSGAFSAAALTVELAPGKTTTIELAHASSFPVDAYCYQSPNYLREMICAHRIQYVGIGKKAFYIHEAKLAHMTQFERECVDVGAITNDAISWPIEAEINPVYAALHHLYPLFSVEIALVNNAEGGLVTGMNPSPHLASLGLNKVVAAEEMAVTVRAAMNMTRAIFTPSEYLN